MAAKSVGRKGSGPAERPATGADYLGLADTGERVTYLQAMHKAGVSLALPLVEDLLCLDLPVAEKRRLLQVADSTDVAAFEAFILRNLPRWRHDLAVPALAAWSARTPRRSWRRLLGMAPERLSEGVFTFCLENAWVLGGRALVAHLATIPEPEQLPGATQAILLRRLTQWSLPDEACMRMAERIILKTVETGCPASPATIFASEYIARFRAENLAHLVANPLSPRYWSDHLQCMYLSVTNADELHAQVQALLATPPADDVEFYRSFFKLWPPVWVRHRLPVAVIAATLGAVTTRPTKDTRGLPASRAVTWELFAGIELETLSAAVAAMPVAGRAAAEALLGTLLTDLESTETISAAGTSDDPARTALFDGLYRETAPPAAAATGDGSWRALLTAMRTPGKVSPKAGKDAIVGGRSLPPIFQQAFYDVLALQQGDDLFLAPLADRIHGADTNALSSVVRAFVGIGTGQALTQAVRVLGLKEASFDVKFELCELLAGCDLAGCQAELRDIVKDLARPGVARTARDYELLDAMRSLLGGEPPPATATVPLAGLDTTELDRDLRRFVPEFDRLPREVVRALRTGRLVGRTLGVGANDGIDISPIVDLQYKGLEILFRQTQGPGINQLVQSNSGILQRKLDLIGYGRAGRGRVEAFETYLTSLPVVVDIPQFSRFKLSKILQTIALHRPGKRFGLDGLKAFAIFMLVFGRRQCEYGLERLFPVVFPTDRELLEFCRDLNMLQDIRNRAVHEGLAPGFHKEAEALWSLTGSLIGRSLSGLQQGR